MMRLRHVVSFVLLMLGACACGRQDRLDRSSRRMLEELDRYVATRELYVARKLQQTDALRYLVQSASDPQLHYEAEMNLADAFFSFSFDSTQVYLKHCQTLAADVLSDKDRYDRATIKLGLLYTKSGSFMEAYNLLYNQLDTARLSESMKTEYLQALYAYSQDVAGNSGMVEQLNIPDAAHYRALLQERVPADSELGRILLRDAYIDDGRLQAADSVGRILLGSTHPEEHSYAIHAFFQSVIAERMGDAEARLGWLVRSAESDIQCAVKDYASLTMVAQLILQADVDRSFQYLRVSQEDALFFNSRLRPWQIARSMLQVQDAYSARRQRLLKMESAAAILLGLLTLALAIVAWSYVARSKKLTRLQQELQESNAQMEAANAQLAAANAQLSQLNQEISTADHVKERFILSFLETFAQQIHLIRSEDNRLRNLLKRGKSDQLLRSLSDSSRAEKARQKFFYTFDTTFLAMYPNFVRQFNELLQEEARVVVPEGRLNTELRIFALIRLGVDDSKQIASMLDYSLSTIYNYKVSVKNHAAVDRDSFEERVKMIGK